MCPESKEIAVLNPNVFVAMQYKTLRYCFYSSTRYAEFRERVKGLPYVDIFPLRGFHDVVIRHLDREVHSLRFLLKGAAALLEDELVFTATKFIRWGGEPSNPPVGLRQNQEPLPRPQENDLEDLVRLCHNWNHPEVSTERRRELVKQGFAYPLPRKVSDLRELNYRKSVMLLMFPYGGDAIVAMFENALDGILSRSGGKALVFCRGESAQGFNYLIEVEANPYETDDLINEIHSWAQATYISLGTRTMDLLEPLANDIWSSLSRPIIEAGELDVLQLLQSKHVPLTAIPTRLNAIAGFMTRNRAIVEKITDVGLKSFLDEACLSMVSAMALELYQQYTDSFMNITELLRNKFYARLKTYYGEIDKGFRQAQEELKLKDWRLDKLTFGDLKEAFLRWIELTGEMEITDLDTQVLHAAAFYRNALVHHEYQRIQSPEMLERTFSDLIRFIRDHYTELQ